MQTGYRLDIKERFTIIPSKKGRYASFPTMIRVGDSIWMTCRVADTDDKIVHGFKGEVRMFSCDSHDPCAWKAHGTLFRPGKESVNEIDAVISNPDDKMLFLSTRDYSPGRGGAIFLSVREIQGIQAFMDGGRIPLDEISDTRIVCFGHVRKTGEGEYLMPGYYESPKLLYSTDQGRSWNLRSVLASSEKEGTQLSEFSIVQTAESEWAALIRNETAPFPLFSVRSCDNGWTWSPPQPTVLLGHAPMIIKALDGKLVTVFRDLSCEQAGVGIGISLDGGKSWEYGGALATYDGSIYDGGYADILELQANRFLAVYYLGNEAASPGIEGCVFSIIPA